MMRRTPGVKDGLARRSVLRAGAATLAAAGAGSLVSGCGSQSATSGKSTVRLWSWYTEQRDEWPRVIAEFERSHPSVRIENRLFGDTASYLPALQAAVAAGDPPEIFAPHILAIAYGRAGIAVDLKKEMGSDFLSRFFASENQQFTDAGKQYALGWMAQTFGLFYNPAPLRAARVDPPETWDDLRAAAEPLRRAGVTPVMLNNNPGNNGLDFWLPLITQATDDPELVLDLDQQRGGRSWNSPPVVESLEMVRKLIEARVFNDGINGVNTQQAETAFYTGRAAMLFMGSWAPQDFHQSASKEFLKTYRVVRTPAWAQGRRHWCADQAGAALAVSTTGNTEAALEFLSFLYQEERYARMMNDSASMPSTTSAAQHVRDPVLAGMTSWLLEGDGCPHILFGPGSQDATANHLAAVIQGSESPAKAAAAMQRDVKRVIARTQPG